MPERKRHWTNFEVKRLKALWAATRPYQYAEIFPDRTRWAITHMASRLGLRKKYPKPKKRERKLKMDVDAHVYQTFYFDNSAKVRKASR